MFFFKNKKDESRKFFLGYEENTPYYAILRKGEHAVFYRGHPESGNSIKFRELPYNIRQSIVTAYAEKYRERLYSMRLQNA